MLHKVEEYSPENGSGIFECRSTGQNYTFEYKKGIFKLMPPVQNPDVVDEFNEEVDNIPVNECEVWYKNVPPKFKWKNRPDVLYFKGFIGDFFMMEVAGTYHLGTEEIHFTRIDRRLICLKDLVAEFVASNIKILYYDEAEKFTITSIKPKGNSKTEYWFHGYLGEQARLKFIGVFDVNTEGIIDFKEYDQSKHVMAEDEGLNNEDSEILTTMERIRRAVKKEFFQMRGVD